MEGPPQEGSFASGHKGGRDERGVVFKEKTPKERNDDAGGDRSQGLSKKRRGALKCQGSGTEKRIPFDERQTGKNAVPKKKKKGGLGFSKRS